MKTIRLPIVLCAVLLFAGTAWSGPVTSLWDWALTINGTEYNPPAPPANVNMAGFNTLTGLGTITMTFQTPGAYTAGAWLDIDIDEGFGIAFNEYGAVNGAPPAGLTWMLAPGMDLWPAFSTDTLDNTNHVPAYSPPPDACCDVSWALIREFILDAGFQATVTFSSSTTVPAGFYLRQTDADLLGSLDGDSAFFSSTLTITPLGPTIVPEPATWQILAGGAAVLLCLRRRTR